MAKFSFLRKWLKWLLAIMVFVAIPASFIYFGFARLANLEKNQRRRLTEQRIQTVLLKLENDRRTESFLAQKFWNAFYRSATGNRLRRFKLLRQRLNNSFEFIAWNKNSEIIDSTIDPQSLNGDWALTRQSVEKGLENKDRFSAQEEKNYKQAFGPQFFPEMLRECRYETSEYLVWPAVSKKRSLLWAARSRELFLLVFVAPDTLASPLGLQYNLDQESERLFNTGYLHTSQLRTDGTINATQEVREILAKPRSLSRGSFVVGSSVFFFRQLEEQLSIFAWYDKGSLTKAGSISAFTATAVFLVLMLPFMYLSFTAIILNKAVRFSISFKLSLLFVFAAGLPLSILGFVGYEYLSQKEYALLDDIHEQATRFLQNFDERYESEFAYRTVKIQEAIKDYMPELKEKGIEPKGYFRFIRKIVGAKENLSEHKIFFVASNTKEVGIEKAIYTKNGVTRLRGYKVGKTEADTVRIYRKLGEFLLNNANNQPVNAKLATEIELISESVMQKNLYELQQEFIATDKKISSFGLGSRKVPTYADIISASENGNHDFLLIVYWTESFLPAQYLQRQFLNANRNIDHLQIMVSSESYKDCFPAQLARETELRKYVSHFTRKPHPPRQFFELNQQKYLIMGFKGKFLQKFTLFALYPTRQIKDKIDVEKRRLVFAGFFAILIILVLGNLLARSFIFPLHEITRGAEAIKNKNFDLRLSALGNDEFGDIALMFNETMVDFGELKVAGVIQEQLLPQALPESGRFKLMGRTVSPGDVGGNYYDYFNCDENKFSVLLGEVSGKGVSAALIMAMAKAAVLSSDEQLAEPQPMVQKVNSLICSTQNARQELFMSLQYITFDSLGGRARLVNAGGPSPLIVDSIAQTVKELKLTGPLLGKSSDSDFAEIEFRLNEGQALILYTEEVFKAKNLAGQEFGFERFIKLVLESFAAEPCEYYNNIHRAYCSHVSGAHELSGDMTMIILTFS